ncbi:MAG: type II secretion system secretin GspD [Nannocystaceae bacterium]|nr:type II secretion system secretin GspD [Nannocystaceae bacterium]
MSARSIVALATTLGLCVPQALWAAPSTRGSGAPRPPSSAPPKPDPGKDADAEKDDGGGRGGGNARPSGKDKDKEKEDDDAGAELSGDEGGVAGHNICRKQPRGAKFRITLPKEAELDDLVNWMMSVSCQKFIWDPKVRGGKVTILSPEPVTVEEAYAAFYASLQTMGLTVEPSGEYFKIVETADAKGRTLPVYGPGGRAPDNDRYVTQLYRVTSGNAADIVTLIDKLKTKQGSVDQIGELVVITDTGASVRRLLKIVQQLDDPKVSAEKIFFFQLRYADPEAIAETIREIFGEKAPTKGAKAPAKPRGKGGAAQAADAGGAAGELGFSRVIVDERTGTLIIVAQEQDYQVIRKLIEQLDVPLSGGAGRIHVVKLRNADPEEVANVLTQLGSGAQARKGGGAGRQQGQQGQQAQQPAAPPGAQPGETFSGDIRVTADPATRSLVILASQSDFEALREVIDALDAERKQVYLEVYLLELNIDKVIEAGVGAHFGAGFNVDAAGTSGQGVGFVANAPSAKANSLALSSSVLPGLAAGVLGPQIPGSGALTGLGQDIPAFGVIIQALQQDSDVNFVAEPHLYTADNQEASIEVGRNVPTPGAVSFNPGGGGPGGGLVPFQSIQRQDVSLSVKVTPHVNDGKTVTLDIEMENNEIADVNPTLGVTTTKRRLKLEKVVARDDQPVVLGGLVQEVERESTSQVPGLGQVPLLGWLFKSKRRQKTKVNLLMIMVPHILETPDDARRIHKRRLDERMEFLERYTAFKRRDLATNVNYRKKSGLLAAVNAEANRMLDDETARAAAEAEMQRTEITGEIGLSPARYESDEDEPAEPGGGVPTTPPPTRPAQPAIPNQPTQPPRKPG